MGTQAKIFHTYSLCALNTFRRLLHISIANIFTHETRLRQKCEFIFFQTFLLPAFRLCWYYAVQLIRSYIFTQVDTLQLSPIFSNLCCKFFRIKIDLKNDYCKNVFMGDAQQHTRLCAMYYYIIEPLSLIFRQAPEAIVATINDIFVIQVQPIIHRITEERVVLSFPDHWESVQAFRLESKGTTLYINGVPYHFTIDFQQSHLMTVRSDKRITV